MKSAGEVLDAIGRVPLADLPTPLQEAPRLARHLGLVAALPQARRRHRPRDGGKQGEEARVRLRPDPRGGVRRRRHRRAGRSRITRSMTAAAARRLGLDVKLVLGGPDFAHLRGNMLLDALYGAEVRYLVDDDDNDSLAAAMDVWVRELREEGRRPYALPIGGSTGAGALGYVRAVRELASQLGDGPVQIVTAVGSCGTFAGLNLGARLFLPAARIVGISVSRTARQDRRPDDRARRRERRPARNRPPPLAGSLECHDRFHGEYGVATDSGMEAIRACARLEGVLLDPIYTGKSMAGLFALARDGSLDPSVPVVFLHTGGLPILFAFDHELDDGAPITKIPIRTPQAGPSSPAGPRQPFPEGRMMAFSDRRTARFTLGALAVLTLLVGRTARRGATTQRSGNGPRSRWERPDPLRRRRSGPSSRLWRTRTRSSPAPLPMRSPGSVRRAFRLFPGARGREGERPGGRGHRARKARRTGTPGGASARSRALGPEGVRPVVRGECSRRRRCLRLRGRSCARARRFTTGTRTFGGAPRWRSSGSTRRAGSARPPGMRRSRRSRADAAPDARAPRSRACRSPSCGTGRSPGRNRGALPTRGPVRPSRARRSSRPPR